MQVICHFNILLTDAGVMHEAGLCTLSGAPTTISHLDIYISCPFFIIWEVLLANAC